jgi:hypothetical protein
VRKTVERSLEIGSEIFLSYQVRSGLPAMDSSRLDHSPN